MIYERILDFFSLYLSYKFSEIDNIEFDRFKLSFHSYNANTFWVHIEYEALNFYERRY